MAGNTRGIATKDKRATLGHPSQVWQYGLERRLNLMRRYVSFEGARILDLGCGVGAFVRRLGEFSSEVYGMDADAEHLQQGAKTCRNLIEGGGEYLPFSDGAFDIVLLHEVIEHVTNDSATLKEVCRILRPGGRAIIFCPNRLYPFETHGMFWGKRYVFGNIPLINYLPRSLRDRLAPHARTYLWQDLSRLWRDLPLTLVVRSIVFPGFDNVAARSPGIGGLLRNFAYRLEGTPLRNLGISHFVILKRTTEKF